MSNPVTAVVDGVTSAPGKVLSMWQKPWFWIGALVVVVGLILVVLYVSTAREYALAKLTAKAITSAPPAPPAAADMPAQPEPLRVVG